MMLNAGDGSSKTMPGEGVKLMPGANLVVDESLWERATSGGMAAHYLTSGRLQAARVDGNFATIKADLAVEFVSACGNLVFLEEAALSEKRPAVAKAIADRIKTIMTPRKATITEARA